MLIHWDNVVIYTTPWRRQGNILHVLDSVP